MSTGTTRRRIAAGRSAACPRRQSGNPSFHTRASPTARFGNGLPVPSRRTPASSSTRTRSTRSPGSARTRCCAARASPLQGGFCARPSVISIPPIAATYSSDSALVLCARLRRVNAPEKIRLTQFSHGGGCGCKIAPAVLSEILSSTPLPGLPQELLVGTQTPDDPAGSPLNDTQALGGPTHFFTPHRAHPH